MSSQLKLLILSFSDSSTKETRKNLSVDLNDSIEKFQSFVSDSTDQRNKKCDVIYKGIILRKDRSLKSYGIRNNSTIQVVIKDLPPPIPTESPSDREIQRIFNELQTLMKSGHTAKFVELVTNRSKLESLIQASPGLGHDLFAYSLIQDIGLLAPLLSDKNNVFRTLQIHPCLGQATLHAVQTIMAEVRDKPSGSSTASSAPGESRPLPGTPSTPQRSVGSRTLVLRPYGEPVGLPMQDFSVDQNMEVDDEDEEQGAMGGMMRQPGFTRPPDNSRSNIPQQRSTISSDFFRSALADVFAASTSSTPSTPNVSSSSSRPPPVQPSPSTPTSLPPAGRWHDQLVILRDMGVTNEFEALQALDATNGDIEAALNVIFG